MWRWPLGSGGKRVTGRGCLPEAMSSRTMSRMKLLGGVASAGVVDTMLS
jgi:hypothetical protein